MLLLSRNEGERLQIQTPDGQYLTVSVLRVKGHQVSIGISAPDNYIILREELLPAEDIAEST